MHARVSRTTATAIVAVLAVVGLATVAVLLVVSTTSSSATQIPKEPWSLQGPLLTANLPVERCATSYGATRVREDALPRHQLAVVTKAQWRKVAMYTDGLGTLQAIGPTAWSCTALDAVDGSSTLVIYPPGERPPTWGHVTEVRAGIVASQTGGCSGCSLETACPLFRAASIRYAATYGVPCRHAPRGEELRTTSLAWRVLFIDPPGVLGAGRPSGGADAAYGVMLWHLPGDPRATAWRDTCTLPASDRALCVTSVRAFLARTDRVVTPRAPRRSR